MSTKLKILLAEDDPYLSRYIQTRSDPKSSRASAYQAGGRKSEEERLPREQMRRCIWQNTMVESRIEIAERFGGVAALSSTYSKR